MASPWMTTTEIAHDLGVSSETVRRLIKERYLRASALAMPNRSPVLRVRRSDFDRFRRSYVKDTQSDDWE